MAAKRVGLSLGRAVRRIRQDAWDDIWPDPLNLALLPRTIPEFVTMRRRLVRLRDGRARVPRAREALIPKPNGLMRPAHQLTIEARIYYQALVDSFMYDIDKGLVGKNHVFGYRPLAPRSTKAPFGFGLSQWKRFRKQVRAEVKSGKFGAMVRTDLAAFYERIPHGPLEARLTSLGVRDDVAKELRSLLKELMGKASGLPQGPDPSGLLASVYLHPLDRSVIAAGYGYVRYVDDIYVLARDRTDAKRALRLLEAEARRLDLIVQSAKTDLVVGLSEMETAVSDDDEIAAVDYVVKRRPRAAAGPVVRGAWKELARRKSPQRRELKYLLGRLTDNRDPVAVKWCLARLGELDYIAPTVARYLACFATRPTVQIAVARHLASPDNISEWEEMNLLRAMLTAARGERLLLARARTTLANRNAGIEVRQFAALVLGKLGDGSDHDVVARDSMDLKDVADASLVALQAADPKTRGKHTTDVVSRYGSGELASKVKGRRFPVWPVFG